MWNIVVAQDMLPYVRAQYGDTAVALLAGKVYAGSYGHGLTEYLRDLARLARAGI